MTSIDGMAVPALFLCTLGTTQKIDTYIFLIDSEGHFRQGSFRVLSKPLFLAVSEGLGLSYDIQVLNMTCQSIHQKTGGIVW